MPRAASVFPSDCNLNQRFPKQFHLRSKADFAALRRGRRLSCGSIRLVYRPNQLEFSRLGLAISRKYGNAVERNRLKRQLREAFRNNHMQLPGFDILVFPGAREGRMLNAGHDFSQALAMIRNRNEGK